MSISGKHFYRFHYLKSDHWDSLRLRKLVQQDGKCALCRHPAYNNDVHHVEYRKLYDVQFGDLRIVCRECHDQVHRTLSERPDIKLLRGNDQWSKIQRALWKKHTVWRIIPHCKSYVYGMHKAFLLAARERLMKAGVISDYREMPLCNYVYRQMQRIGYRTDYDLLLICLSLRYPIYPYAQCGEH